FRSGDRARPRNARVVVPVRNRTPVLTSGNKLTALAGQHPARLVRCSLESYAPMRRFLVLALYLCTSAATAGEAATLSYDDARHLLNRTGFGATDAEIRRFTGMIREEAARTLLAEP